jgi:putative transcriptional regulator
MTTLQGQLLISAGGLFDANFRQTVVLIGTHDARGAVGVILNRPLDVTVLDAIPTLAALVGSEDALHEGGPVETNQAVVLVEAVDDALLDVRVFGSVGFVTGDVPLEVGVGPCASARVFVGYAGWGPGQLEARGRGRRMVRRACLVRRTCSLHGAAHALAPAAGAKGPLVRSRPRASRSIPRVN